MRYLLAGGGTGGHIYPALAILEGLRAVDPEAEFLYVGMPGSREAQVVPKEGIPFATITSGGLINLGLMAKVKGALNAARGVFAALSIMRKFRPDVVIGTGGFVCGPVYVAARLYGVPLVIQEGNAYPGVTNKFAARWAKAFFVPYPEVKKLLPVGTKVVESGVPVRQSIAGITREQGRQAFGLSATDQVVVVMGGSGGARDFNKAVAAAVKQLLPTRPDLQVLHVTGERYYDQVTEAYGEMAARVKLYPYLHNMPEAMAAADLGIFRAGMMTITEIQVRGLPSILIPSPNVTHNHQEHNARSLERRGGVVVMVERDLTPAGLAEQIGSLLDDRNRRESLRQSLLKMAEPDAARTVAERIVRLIKG